MQTLIDYDIKSKDKYGSNLLQGTRQPDRHGQKQQGRRAAVLPGFFTVEEGDVYKRQDQHNLNPAACFRLAIVK